MKNFKAVPNAVESIELYWQAKVSLAHVELALEQAPMTPSNCIAIKSALKSIKNFKSNSNAFVEMMTALDTAKAKLVH